MFRTLFAVAFLINFIVAARYRRQAQGEETFSLAEEKPPVRVALRAGGLALWFYCLAYIVLPHRWLRWSFVPVPDRIRQLAFAIAAGVMPLLIHWAQNALGRNVSPTIRIRPEHELVTRGPYRYIRHPLYTFGTVLFALLALVAGSWFLLLAAATALFLVSLRLPQEEAKLAERFGEQYRRYQRRTGRFLPKLL